MPSDLKTLYADLEARFAAANKCSVRAARLNRVRNSRRWRAFMADLLPSVVSTLIEAEAAALRRATDDLHRRCPRIRI
jgi:hypothetical protein